MGARTVRRGLKIDEGLPPEGLGEGQGSEVRTMLIYKFQKQRGGQCGNQVQLDQLSGCILYVPQRIQFSTAARNEAKHSNGNFGNSW